MMNRKVLFWPFLRSFGSDQGRARRRAIRKLDRKLSKKAMHAHYSYNFEIKNVPLRHILLTNFERSDQEHDDGSAYRPQNLTKSE